MGDGICHTHTQGNTPWEWRWFEEYQSHSWLKQGLWKLPIRVVNAIHPKENWSWTIWRAQRTFNFSLHDHTPCVEYFSMISPKYESPSVCASHSQPWTRLCKAHRSTCVSYGRGTYFQLKIRSVRVNTSKIFYTFLKDFILIWFSLINSFCV